MKRYPKRLALVARLSERVDDLAVTFSAPVFRFVEPQHSTTKAMFAGKGPIYANGRWLAKGKKLAVYTSLLPETALAEALAANRYYGFPDGRSAPLVFVTAAARLKRVIDLRDGMTRRRLRLGIGSITDTDWRQDNLKKEEAISQAWGWAMHEAGIEGFLCPSAALRGGENLIAFPENIGGGSRLKVTSEVEWPR